jgi:hypothetical protein
MIYQRIFPLLLFALLGTSCQSSGNEASTPAAAITNGNACTDRILEQDGALGKIRNYACERAPMSEVITNYSDGLEALGFSACPEGFTRSFAAHVEAWRTTTVVTDQYPKLRGEMHDVFAIIEAGKDSTAFKALVADIWATWAQVEAAAAPD